MLNQEQVSDLINKITQDIIKANRTNQIDNFFLDFSKEKYMGVFEDRLFYTDRSLILIIGGTKLSENNIRAIARQSGIDPDKIECCLDYSKLKSFNFKKLEYNTNYKCILVGPMPHSVPNKGDYESIISKMQIENDRYPTIIILKDLSNELKITNSNLKKALTSII